MQHTPYLVKYQYDIEWELQDLKYEPTMTDLKVKFEEMVLGLHTAIDGLTWANHEAEIVAKLRVSKISSWYEATAWLWIDGNKYEIIATTTADTSVKLLNNIQKSFTNEISHKKK